MEGGFMMVIHSAIITAILYVIMKFVFKQSEMVAQDRSCLFGANVLIYMIMFGHGWPTSINKNIMKIFNISNIIFIYTISNI